MRRILAIAVLVAAGCSSGSGSSATIAGSGEVAGTTGLGTSEWPEPAWGMYGRTLSRTFSSETASPISRSTVLTLLPAWIYKTAKTVTASPAVVDGTLYVGDWAGVMYALDAGDGSLRWKFATEDAPGAAFGPIVSSAAIADVAIAGAVRRLVIFGSGPRLYALDAGDGSLAWERHVGALDDAGSAPADDPTEIESSPLVWEGTVFVGMDTHNQGDERTGGIRGGLLAVDAATGHLRWKFEPELGAGVGCGGVWSSPTLDPARRRVFLATANCTKDFAWTRHVEAVTALDADTGQVEWAFQPHPPNRKDWDFGATPNLFRDRDGREVLGAGNKDGAYYALDPEGGGLLWRRQVAQGGDLGEDFAIGGFIGSPAVWRGRVFGGTAIGGLPFYHALEGTDGSVVWQDLTAVPTYAASAVVNGVVFHGALDSLLRARDTTTGLPLWAMPVLGPVSSGPAIVGDSVYVGSGTSSSDLCGKDTPIFSDVCTLVFEEATALTGGVHAFRLLGGAP